MSKDVTDMKKWFNDLGLDVDGQIDDNELKKYASIKIYLRHNYLLFWYFVKYLLIAYFNIAINLHRLMPPQRRDLWRTIIMKHVLPTEKVNLIKKSLLLHKLEKRQKPLMVKKKLFIKTIFYN